MFIDTHLHLSYKEGVNPDIFIQNATSANVNRLVVSCCDKESILEGLELVKQFDNVFLTVGFHPEFTDSINDDDLEWLKEIAKTCSKVVGIGEIGLDFHYVKDNVEEQKSLFKKQLEIACELDLPVVIHTRDSIQATFDILKNYSLCGSIHCYSGSVEMAREFIKLGYYLGIGGVVTFSNSKLFEVVEEVGLSSILLETDSPYLAPVPYRGKINESKNIPIIAERIANILSVSSEEVARVTTENACSLFDFENKL